MEKIVKQNLVIKHLQERGSITARELTGAPFYFNCPHGVIRNLRSAGYEIKDETIKKTESYVVDGKQYNNTTLYKRYYLEGQG